MHQLINLNDNSTSISSESISSLNENNQDNDKSVQELIDFVENEFINKEYNLSTNTSPSYNEYNNNLQFDDNLFKRDFDQSNKKELNTDHFYESYSNNLIKKETNEQKSNEHLLKKESNDNSYNQETTNLSIEKLNKDHSFKNEFNEVNLSKQKINDHLYEKESNNDYHSYRKELNDAINNLTNSSSSIGQQEISNTFFDDSRSSSPTIKKTTPKKRSSSIKRSLSPNKKRSPIRKKSPIIKRKISPCKKTSTNQDVHIPRPPNAFMIFGKFNRKLLANQYPQFTNKEISKILGDEWRNLKPNDKEHYHELSNKAHVEHLKKYPGYYYNPLEARKRKADRQNKNVQKTNSKRIYGKQNYLEEQLNYDNQLIDSNKLHLTTTLTSSATITPSISTATITNNNCQQNDSSTTKLIQPNFKLKCEDNQLNNYTQSSIQLPPFRQQQQLKTSELNKQFDNNLITNVSKRSNNQFNSNRQFNNQQDELNDCQNFLQPNVLYRSNNDNNNVLNYLLNGNNSSGNLNEILNNEKFMNQNSIHHHYQANCYTTPTIYHITDKDPNLNSTLNDNCFSNNNSNLNNGNMSGIINYNLNNNFLSNLNISNQQNSISSNQILLQNHNAINSISQTNSISQNQIYSQDHHLNHRSTTSPLIDSFSMDEFLAEFNKYNSQQVQVSRNQFNKQN